MKCRVFIGIAIAVVAVSSRPTRVHGGVLGSELPWISWVTPIEELEINNDDFVGPVPPRKGFHDTPGINQFTLNRERGQRQRVLEIERLIPTIPSGGVTEYFLAISVSFNAEPELRLLLDSALIVELGFGTGENFVPAATVTPELRFDEPGSVSPYIEDHRQFDSASIHPTSRLIDHQSDSLTFALSTFTESGTCIEGYNSAFFGVPIDLPDLDLSVRDFYSAEELSLLTSDDRPFTIRSRPLFPAGDLDQNGNVDAHDIDILSSKVAVGEKRGFDMNGDCEVNIDDITTFLDFANRPLGDADFDGSVGFADFLILSRNFGTPATYTEGDFNADGEVQFSDFLILSANFGGSTTEVVPEGMHASWLAIGLIFLIRSRKPRKTYQRWV